MFFERQDGAFCLAHALNHLTQSRLLAPLDLYEYAMKWKHFHHCFADGTIYEPSPTGWYTVGLLNHWLYTFLDESCRSHFREGFGLSSHT